MVIETLMIMALMAAQKSLALDVSDLSNEPSLPKAIRNEIKLNSKSHFPNLSFIHFIYIYIKKSYKTDLFT